LDLRLLEKGYLLGSQYVYRIWLSRAGGKQKVKEGIEPLQQEFKMQILHKYVCITKEQR
jgi:hypothetical protein